MAPRPRLLLLIGNTSLRWRVERGGELAEGGAAPVGDPPPEALRGLARACDAYAASVNPPRLARIRAELGAPIPAVGEDIPIPIENRTREPARVGADRLLAALGIQPEVCHLNEGHAAFVVLERARSFMEDTGYMARAAFIMDRVMHTMGLHGKSFIPLIMGFGCNVPAIMATRSLENRQDRILTILINPFMSCSARLPVWRMTSKV